MFRSFSQWTSHVPTKQTQSYFPRVALLDDIVQIDRIRPEMFIEILRVLRISRERIRPGLRAPFCSALPSCSARISRSLATWFYYMLTLMGNALIPWPRLRPRYLHPAGSAWITSFRTMSVGGLDRCQKEIYLYLHIFVYLYIWYMIRNLIVIRDKEVEVFIYCDIYKRQFLFREPRATCLSFIKT